jgi:hypothetical protein
MAITAANRKALLARARAVLPNGVSSGAEAAARALAAVA